MMAIESYLAFIIIVMGTLLSAREISDEEKQQYFQNILEEHNNYRDKHGSKPLELDEEMCKEAMILTEEWIENSGSPKIPNKYGANYARIGLNDDAILDTKLLIENWYSYESLYDYNNGLQPRKPSNPFTQIVWKNTERLGVGISQRGNLVWVLVLYSPAGNQIEQYLWNVINPQVAEWQKMQFTDNEEEQFIHDILIAHNYYRENHNSSHLILDKELCEMAKIRVREWVTFITDSPPREYGVYYHKIFFNSKSTLDPKQIVKSWYESNNYEYIIGPSKPHSTNPSTRLIWEGREKIGVGVVVVGSILYIVVVYSPGGNQSGQQS